MTLQGTKEATDAVAGIGVVGTWLGYLPEIAAGFAIIWYLVRFYDWWMDKRKAKKNGSS